MTLLEDARGQEPVAPVDEKGVAYGVKRTGNVPHVKLDDSHVILDDGSVVKTQQDSVTTLTNPAGDPITTTPDVGGKTRLDVAAAGDTNPTLYQLRVDYDPVGDVVGTTDVSLFYFEGEGILTFVGMLAGGSSYEAIIKVDGVEQLRISMTDLGANLGLANGTNVPMWAETANKNFRFHPNEGMGFSYSIEILARSTSGSNTVKHICMYKELQT